MLPLNPFLRALFRSTVPGQAIPVHNHVLLVPTTESLLNGKDETGKRYTEIVQDEDFIASHIVRIVQTGAKDVPNVRDNRGKAKTYPTVNGKTVIIKEHMVYSNKGFRQLTQAQMLTDVLYYSTADNQQWLIYYISKPLVGTFEPIIIPPAVIGGNLTKKVEEAAPVEPMPKKKDVKSFSDLLNSFPMIARQMQPGLERLVNEFGKELGKPLPPPPSRTPSTHSLERTSTNDSLTRVGTENGSIHSFKSNGSLRLPFGSASEETEDLMRRALETAVTAAIDLFQLVDKQQLSLLGATTDLTGPAVERLIERYVAEQVHNNLLFPRLKSLHKAPDAELDRRIRHMENLDVSQVGIAIDDGMTGKRELLRRVNAAVAIFRKMGVAGSPQEMLDILLETQKALTDSTSNVVANPEVGADAEKRAAPITINADILVSLLLLVVIRSQTRHLQARLAYMSRFIFIDDVESGEIGYALSTFEGVLTYLAEDAAGLRKASQQNKKLWDLVKKGQTDGLKDLFEHASAGVPDGFVDETEPLQESSPINGSIGETEPAREETMVPLQTVSSFASETTLPEQDLSHVFPFQTTESSQSFVPPGKRKKRVTMDVRSMSMSSAVSYRSYTNTLDSAMSGIEGDTSIESLARTQDPSGNSVLMMAAEARQADSLSYLLTLPEHYGSDVVLSDSTSEGTTLLSAIIQLAHTELIDVILNYVLENTDQGTLQQYLAKVDARGRTAAHYLFNAPHLMEKLASAIPWVQKDKIGQTPLYAMCRSYDHPEYGAMITEALAVAKKAQGDGLPLRLGDHVDNKGNTLLHIVNEPSLAARMLQYCDADPNAVNDKRFTPLMLASKYGRLDMVRVFFGDARVDPNLKELRGLTAVELAKDDEVRNRIDDLTLFSSSPQPLTNSKPPENMHASTGRITTIVRSFFVEDGSTRLILKSGAPSNAADATNTTYTITTSRRTVPDFENLAKWLALDHPASYIPSLATINFRSPFQIHSRPSRAVLHNTQTTLDRFLKILLSHPTFATHEMLWEFFLVPDMQAEQMAARAALKAQLLKDTINEEYEPLTDVKEVEQLVAHSRDMARNISKSSHLLIRRTHNLGHARADFSDAVAIAMKRFETLGPVNNVARSANSLPRSHTAALLAYAGLMADADSPTPLGEFIAALTAWHSTNLAVQASLAGVGALVARIGGAGKEVSRWREEAASQSLPRKFAFLEDGRLKGLKGAEGRVMEWEGRVEALGKELRYTREVVVGELAGWTEWRARAGREGVREFVRRTVVRERERLKGLERVVGGLGLRNSAMSNGGGVASETASGSGSEIGSTSAVG
jgi:ankyrin repeat protein